MSNFEQENYVREPAKEIVFKIPQALLPPEPQPPSPFELGVVDQLKGLASAIESGCIHVQHFSLTVKGDTQRLEIEVK